MPQFISNFVISSEINKTASTAGEFSASDEESELNTHLQNQLEEDVASDVYTECNIENQEHEIITYLNEIFNTLSPLVNKTSHAKEDNSEAGAFCSIDVDSIVKSDTQNNSKTKGSSPSTELTREYYALVPISGNFLEKELDEQDKLCDGFLSIIKTQVDDKIKRPNKPTSLPLFENTSNKTVIHSNLSTCLQRISKSTFKDSSEKLLTSSSQVSKLKSSSTLCSTSINDLTTKNSEPNTEKVLESTYSPDSLITDEPSSASDYLSATYTCSPGTSVSSYLYNLNLSDNFIKMERNNFAVSDSGIENTSMLESNNSHLDVTVTDISLSESNLHTCNPEEAGISLHYPQILKAEKNESETLVVLPSTSVEYTSDEKETNGLHINKLEDLKSVKSTKEEKQRQNEEIVTLESSSLSSETGSWESVFPPKLVERDRHVIKNVIHNNDKQTGEDKLQDLKHGGNFVIEETKEVMLRTTRTEEMNETKVRAIPIPSQPVPCITKYDRSPKYGSEGNDNEDSFELPDQMDDFNFNDSPLTIFDMTFEKSKSTEDIVEDNAGPYSTTSIDFYNTKTPNNSILSVKEDYMSIDSEDNSKIKKHESQDFAPITSRDMEVESQIKTNEGHFLHKASQSDICNKPDISETDNDQSISPLMQIKPTRGSAWIVDMSSGPDTDSSIGLGLKTSTENIYENLKYVAKSSEEDNNKSQDLVESNVSEKSSHTFFIDLSSLPETIPANKINETPRVMEKDNMFTMYIDIGDNSTLKGKPPILQSANCRKSISSESRITNKHVPMKTETTGSSPYNNKSFGNNNLRTFEKLESLCNDPNIHINEIIKNPESLSVSDVITEINSFDNFNRNGEDVEIIVTNDNCQNPKRNRVAEESITRDRSDDPSNNNLFVKLSDLDKPISIPSSDCDDIKPDTVLKSRDRMTRSIPDNNWDDGTISGKSIISSFHSENALSLNRLFPHLINKFSKSVPASLPNKTRSSLRLENSSIISEENKHPSDVSEISSMRSSAGWSVVENSTSEETTQTSGVAGSCQSRLGQDLLRMFLEEIATDVIVEVNGKRIKAHKCILSSRCQFFAGILSGGYVESAGNVIVLPPFSYNVAHFVMCHIYAGISVIPDSISIIELATLADMLGLEGLKEAIMFTLKAKYCHHFHKPCQLCIAGVLECFPLSSAYGLDDLYLKCLKWITKYFVRVCPTKAFATLPSELLEKCYHQQAVNFTKENLVECVFGYGMIMASLHNNRWGELLLRMCRRLIQAAAHFAAQRLVDVLHCIGNIPCNISSAAKQALEECFSVAIDWAPPEEACRTYALLSNIVKEMRSQQSARPDNVNTRKASGWNNLLLQYASSWRLQCEGALVRAAPRVVGTKAFQDLPSDLRKRLRELGCILFVSQAAIPGQGSSSQYDKRRSQQDRNVKSTALNTRSLGMDHVRAAFVPYAVKPVIPVAVMEPPKGSVEFREMRKVPRTPQQPPKVRMTRAQEQRAKFNMSKSSPNAKPARCYAPPSALGPKHLASRRGDNDKMNVINSKAGGAGMISSSESSRNSSPGQVRRYRMSSAVEKRHVCEVKAHALSQDSLATSSRPRTAEPSTDSLSESQGNNNKYATYTKTRHAKAAKGPVGSVQPAKCHALSSRDVEQQCRTKPNKTVGNGTNQQFKENNEQKKRYPNTTTALPKYVKPPGKYIEKTTSGSLMNATKSSSAKMVTKVAKGSSKYTKANKTPVRTSNVPDEPVASMNRSGTFLMADTLFSNN